MQSYATFDIAGLQGLRLDPRGDPRVVIVLLHGYAMQPMDLAPLADAMGLPATLYLPCGVQPAQSRGHAWWPVDETRQRAQIAKGARDLYDEYPPGRELLHAKFRAFVAALAAAHPGTPLVFAGFSQGGMLAVDLILQGGLRPQAVVLLSTSRIAMQEWRPQLGKLQALPVLIAHGRDDADLSLAAGERLRDCLQAGGARVSWLPFDGAHDIPLPVWREFKRFVLANLGS